MIIKACNLKRLIHWLLFFPGLLLISGCAQNQLPPPEASHWVYATNEPGKTLAERWAPAFVAFGHADRFNRIGRPTIRFGDSGDEEAFIDPDEPVLYVAKQPFSTGKATYTNVIYRIHFPEVPYSLIPFNLTAGENVGLIVVVTLNAAHLPVLVTTVHTCGCYNAIIPTEYLPRNAFPADWQEAPLDVYGEQLPPLLKFEGIEYPRIVIYLRPGVHRVMELEVRDEHELHTAPFRIIPMPFETMDQLERLPAGKGTTSFYYQEGTWKGHVKGSIKPWETLLLSLVSMDIFVGSDKAYADTGNPFYTSLKPWRRYDSNMWDFPRFLQYWGWRL